MSAAARVSVLSCGMVPYPNQELVRGLEQNAFERGHLCSIRDMLFGSSDRSSGSYYDGRSLGDDRRLSPGQLAELRRMLSTPPLNIDTLVACKIVLGRWLRPSEMAALFSGAKSRLVMQRFPLTGADDARVSFAIGRAGTTLNRVTSQSGCVFIWFGGTRDRPVVSVYARSVSALEKARAMLNQHQATFAGHPQGASNLVKMIAHPSETAPRSVTLKAVYQAMAKTHQG